MPYYKEYREWSASQIDDAQKTTEATEVFCQFRGDDSAFSPVQDAVHEAGVATQGML